ncbi:MAG: hypothetical protein ABI537_16135 [Casimicrobiaceae bacterium]
MPATTPQSSLSRVVAGEVARVALAIAGFKIPTREFASGGNVSGVRSKTQTFSSRHDSRTLYARDSRYGYGVKAGTWVGDDKTVIAACRRVLRAAKVPSREVATVEVVVEMGQVAERLSEEQFRIHDAETLQKLGRARRAVDEIPVWSSYLMVGLTRAGAFGSLELHWPELPAVAVREATVLAMLVERRIFQPPELPDARPETVEAGIIHSPAIGFFMDVVPVIRVIYRNANPELRRKPTLYLDRHGQAVSMPRNIEHNRREATVTRQKPDERQTTSV